MSILIKGMGMPSNCMICPLSVLNGERLYCEVTKEEVVRAKRAIECPLVPAADVVEVVRCKNCIWWEYQRPPQSAHRGRHYCANIDISTHKDFYCGFGEKRQESEDEADDE